jgi:DMSO/TMAO reductase YedYZ molybdopterin-dependent catalytic subunit
MGAAIVMTVASTTAQAHSPADRADSASFQTPRPLEQHGKNPRLVVFSESPLVAETPEDMLDDHTTPIPKFFVRNNGHIPPDRTGNADAWSFAVIGEVARPLTLTLGDLKHRFSARTYRMVLECGGNGRSFFQPATRGNPWTHGGAGCAEWTGAPLGDVLRAAGLTDEARFLGLSGADVHVSGDPNQQAISRGMPIAKGLERHTLIAWAMNGQPLPHLHGGPLRLIVPGWPGSLSQKWLSRILVRKDPHDGVGMGGTSYRVPTVPIVPGSDVDGLTDFTDLTSMPTRAIITAPGSGARFPAGTRQVALRGAAWGGEQHPTRVDVSADGGQSWLRMDMTPRRNKYDWVRWQGQITLPHDGYFEIWVRARDSAGRWTPHVAQNWNPQGYGANPFHRVAVLVG